MVIQSVYVAWIHAALSSINLRYVLHNDEADITLIVVLT